MSTKRVSYNQIHRTLESAILNALGDTKLTNDKIENVVANTVIDVSSQTVDEIIAGGVGEDVLLPNTFITVQASDGYYLLYVGEDFSLGKIAGDEGAETVVSHGDFSTETELLLTTTPTQVTGWVANSITNIVLDSDLIEITNDGDYQLLVERVYRNEDTNPASVINVTIDIQTDDQSGSGYVSSFTKTVSISAATANDEPAFLPFTTPLIRGLTAGTKIRIMVSANEGGINPSSTYFVRSNATIIRLSAIT